MSKLYDLWHILVANVRSRWAEWVIDRREARGDIYPVLDQIHDAWDKE